jgi:hypothetical protein
VNLEELVDFLEQFVAVIGSLLDDALDGTI